MTSVDKVSEVVSQWAFKMAKSVLPQISIPANSTIGHLMGMMRIDPSSYSIWNELGFLAEPLIQTAVTPMVRQYLGAIPEEQIKDIAMKFADAFVKRAQERGSVNIFGIDVGENAFVDLRSMLQSKFNEDGGFD